MPVIRSWIACIRAGILEAKSSKSEEILVKPSPKSDIDMFDSEESVQVALAFRENSLVLDCEPDAIERGRLTVPVKPGLVSSSDIDMSSSGLESESAVEVRFLGECCVRDRRRS